MDENKWRTCDRCGEEIAGGEPRAELAQAPCLEDDPHPDRDHVTMIVHAEPCATDMIASGRWEIA